MKTKRIGIVLLAIAAILALAFLAKREHGQVSAEGQAGSQVVSAEATEGAVDLMPPRGNAEANQVSGDEPTPQMLESMTTATAQITRGDGSKLDIRSIDGECGRVTVEANEHLTIRLALKNGDENQPILIEADNGGILNQNKGPIAVQPEVGIGGIEFQYILGGDTGKYTLYVSQGGRQELLEFWVGPEPSTGRSGPPRFFNPEHS